MRRVALFVLAFAFECEAATGPVFIAYPAKLGGGVLGMTTGPDGKIWFTAAPDRIGRMVAFDVVTGFSGAASAGSITTGADGALWFTQYTPGIIGRLTTAGVLSQYPLPAGTNSLPAGITSGPDGNVWFTELAADKIGRITPTGALTEFPLGPGTTYPQGITSGPDGNLWFTERFRNGIGRMTVSGQLAEFSIPHPSSMPLSITVGPDGALWFTEWNVPAIGRITVTGVLSEFPVGIHAGPSGISAGPDGNLWFTLSNGKIGRITTAGAVTLYDGPPNHGDFLMLGPENALWLAGGTDDNIYRVELADPAAGQAVPMLQPLGLLLLGMAVVLVAIRRLST